MKHFVEARQAAVAALRSPEIRDLVVRACLIVDLRGRCRALVVPLPGLDARNVEQAVEKALAAAAEGFWDKQVWVQENKQSPSEQALYDAVWNAGLPQSGDNNILVLDRRLSKDSWLGVPLEPPWPLIDQTPPIISFYSFKGGVGRTTALVALAVNLARDGKRVLVLDFDLEAPGVGSLLLPPDMISGPGVVDFLLESIALGPGALDISEFHRACDDHGIVGDGEPIQVVPAGVVDDWYLEKLARVNYEYLYRSAREHSLQNSPLHNLFKSLRGSLKPDIVLVDSRAGFHDLGGLSLSGIAHLQVLFGLASSQSWAGLSLAVSHLGKDMVLSGGKQRACAIVQAMAPPYGRTREEEISTFRERSFRAFSENYYNPADAADAEWPLPDPESAESPHFPLVLTRDDKIAGYSTLADVAGYLSEGDYRTMVRIILEKVGRA
jgi:hypothetical protein